MQLTGGWVSHEIRDEVVDYIRHWSERASIPVEGLVKWVGLAKSTFYLWAGRYGKANEHNSWIPRDNWLLDDEKQAQGPSGGPRPGDPRRAGHQAGDGP